MTTDDPLSLSPQERAVLDMVRANPFAGQQDIAAKLGLARPTVAAHIVHLIQKGHILGRGYVLPASQRILCLGGATIDRKYRAGRPLVPGTSNPVDGDRSFGGVARNVAENLARLGVATALASAVGDDENGRAILALLRPLGVDVSQVQVVAGRPTAEYVAVLGPDRDLAFGLADMGIFDQLDPATLDRLWPHLTASAWVFADCNLPAASLARLLERRGEGRFRLAIDAVSTPKISRLPMDLTGIDLLFLNLDEARACLGAPQASAKDAAAGLRARGASAVALTLGADGVLAASDDGMLLIPVRSALVVDVTGAGDALIAGTLHGLLAGIPLMAALQTGTRAAALTLESAASVRPDLSPGCLAAASCPPAPECP